MADAPLSREAANELYWKIVLIIEPALAWMPQDETEPFPERVGRVAIVSGARDKARRILSTFGTLGLLPLHFRPTATPPAYLVTDQKDPSIVIPPPPGA